MRWIADDAKHYLHGSIEKISCTSVLSVNGVDVPCSATLNLQVGDLLKVSTWPMWSAVVMPVDTEFDPEPRAKKPRIGIESKDTDYRIGILLCLDLSFELNFVRILLCILVLYT